MRCIHIYSYVYILEYRIHYTHTQKHFTCHRKPQPLYLLANIIKENTCVHMHTYKLNVNFIIIDNHSIRTQGATKKTPCACDQLIMRLYINYSFAFHTQNVYDITTSLRSVHTIRRCRFFQTDLECVLLHFDEHFCKSNNTKSKKPQRRIEIPLYKYKCKLTLIRANTTRVSNTHFTLNRLCYIQTHKTTHTHTLNCCVPQPQTCKLSIVCI